MEEFQRFCADALSDQHDGFGSAILGENGVYGVRTLDPLFFAHNKMSTPIPFITDPTVTYGKKGETTGAALFHGRTSTNSVSILNTHPIQRDGWTLIHNGVVSNHGASYTQLTTNDSEHVLYNLIAGGIDQVAANLTGYYAFAALDPKGRLHIARDSTAQLYTAWSGELDSYIFATTSDLIKMVGKYLDEKLAGRKVNDCTYLMFQNDVLKKQRTFKERGFTQYESAYSQRSLGHHVGPYHSHAYMEWKNDIPQTTNLLIEDLSDEFLDELEYIDDSYSIYKNDVQITTKEFQNLPLEKQAECEIRRSDNSLIQNLIKVDPNAANTASSLHPADIDGGNYMDAGQKAYDMCEFGKTY